MAIQSGTHLGPYEIVSAIGAGGMGEVYRARDPKLGRDVAIKVLPEAFAGDSAGMARFQREAKVLASLNHPNIATIHGLEDSSGTYALVMELVEGPTLADRIKQGPIPVDEAVRTGRQIADALEYAHERGIIHRDLKPANIKVTADDTVKVLDFGLAKALEGDPASIDISTSPTISRMATQAGVLLGTAAYMSPEQAKAKPVDRRADIWAFGCVLYEMLTGKQAFQGESVTDALAAVIRAEPDWSLLPASTPIRIRVLLQRCLQKDPKQRLRDIGDARISLDEVLSGAPEAAPSVSAAGPPPKQWRWWLASGVAGALMLATASSFVTWNLKPSPLKPVTRFTITLPPGQRLVGLEQSALAFSPDGSELAYVATAQDGGLQQIYLRAMDGSDARPISGTDGATNPFFSPDGMWLGFFADGKLKRIPVSGGAPVTLADAGQPRGASWGSRGTIIFAPATTGTLEQVSDGGGTPKPLFRLDEAEISHRWPEFLSGSNALLFVSGATAGNWLDGHVEAQPVGANERRDLVQGAMSPHYAPPGHLIYAQEGNLMAVPFDSERLQVTGTPVAVARGVLQQPGTGAAQYSISGTGSLAYVPGGTLRIQRRLVWVSRNGTEQSLGAPVRSYLLPRLSPDGRRIAVGVTASEGTQIWLYDLARDTLSRFTFQGNNNSYPVWTADGAWIAFSSSKEGRQHIFRQLADGSGTAERLFSDEYNKFPTSFSPDGQLLTFYEATPTTGSDIWVLRLGNHQAQPYARTPANEAQPELSPDGRWMAYASDESGRWEVFVQPYPGPGGKWQISTDGGAAPVWNRNGHELFYRSGDKVMAVEIATQPSFVAGKPRMLFQGSYTTYGQGLTNYDVSPDGQRFLMLKPVEQEQATPTQINVVLNWTEELKRLVPTGK